MSLTSSRPERNLIGPNAVTQLIAAAHDLGMSANLDQLFDRARVQEWLQKPPCHMVDEIKVSQLHRAVRLCLPQKEADDLFYRAGERTGVYILTHRIPKFAQYILENLPKHLAAKLLTKAILSHAWTFAGTGDVKASMTDGVKLAIRKNPLCCGEIAPAPVCIWHSAVFSTLYGRLVSPTAQAQEISCCAVGAEACKFQISI